MSLSQDLEIGWEEEYALGDEEQRIKALAKLVPGTREYYYFTLLHLLNTAEIGSDNQVHFKTLPSLDIEFSQLLASFKQLFPSSLTFGFSSSPSLSATDIEFRYLVLRYRAAGKDEDPTVRKQLAKELAVLFGVSLAPPDLGTSSIASQTDSDTPVADANSQLDPDNLSFEEWLAQSPKNNIDQTNIFSFLLQNPSHVRKLSIQAKREFLDNFLSVNFLYCPDVILDLIIELFNAADFPSTSRGRSPFQLKSCQSLLAKMTRAQLDKLRDECDLKKISSDQSFFSASLAKLQPPGLPAFSTEMTISELRQMEEYLTDLLSFLSNSSPKFLSTKAIVIYHLLALYRRLGTHLSQSAQDIFTKEWIPLPRSSASAHYKQQQINQTGSSSWRPQQQQQSISLNSNPLVIFNDNQSNRLNAYSPLFDDADDDEMEAPVQYNQSSRGHAPQMNAPNFFIPSSSANRSNNAISFSVESSLIPSSLSSFTAEMDAQMTRSYIFDYFFTADSGESDSPAVWADHLQESFLQGIRAEAYLLAGKGDPSIWIDQLESSRNIRTMKDETIIEFDASNSRFFASQDPVVLRVWLKNVTKVVVKVFEINTENWYRTKLAEIDTSISLDGLVAPDETVHDFSSHPPLRRFQHDFKLAVPQKRGVFVVELIGNGKSSRALIRKGQIQFRERLTVAGHAFTLLDEDFQPIDDGRVLIPPSKSFRVFLPSLNSELNTILHPQEILIPYLPANESARQQPILLQASGFSSFGRFLHRPEVYSMSSGLYVNREHLLPSSQAHVIIRPRLFTAGGFAYAPLTLIKTASVLVKSSDQDTIPSITEIPLNVGDLQLHGCADVPFVVPPGIVNLSITLQLVLDSLLFKQPVDPDYNEGEDESEEYEADAAVPDPSSSSTVATLSDVLNIAINNNRNAQSIIQPFFLPTGTDEYRVVVLGRSGEPIPQKRVDITLKHVWFRSTRTFTLITDPNGSVLLGRLDPNLYSYVIFNCEGISNTLPLNPRQTFSWPLLIHLSDQEPESQQVCLPSFSGSHRLFAVNEHLGVVLHDLTHVLQFDATTSALQFSLEDITQHLPTPGLITAQFQLHIVGAPTPINLMIHSSSNLLEPAPKLTKPAYIALVEETNITPSKKESARMLRLVVKNPTSHSRVHISTSSFAPPFDFYALINRPPQLQPSSTRPGRTTSSFVSGRELSDEIRYISNRKYMQTFPGAFTSLSLPSLLVTPFKVKDTAESQGVALAGNQYSSSNAAAEQLTNRASAQVSSSQNLQDAACIDFLAYRPSLLSNIKVPIAGNSTTADFTIALPPEFDESPFSHLQVVLTDDTFTAQSTLSLQSRSQSSQLIRRHHLALDENQALDMSKHYVERCQCEIISPEATFSAAKSTTGHNLEFFDSLTKVFTFFLSICSNQLTLKEFDFLLKWNTLSFDNKQELYAKFACHELNFFIFKKDPEFFQVVVLHHLQNRLSSSLTLIDLYLLDAHNQLSEFLSPHRFSQLNIFEQILLAERQGAIPNLVRTIQDSLQSSKDPQFDRTRFLTALAIHRMDPNRMETLDGYRAAASPALYRSAAKPKASLARRTSMCSMDDFLPPTSASRNLSCSDDDDDDVCSSYDRPKAKMMEKKKQSYFGKAKQCKSASSTSNRPINLVRPVERSSAASEIAESRYYRSTNRSQPSAVLRGPFWLDFALFILESSRQASSSVAPPSDRQHLFLSTNLHSVGSGVSELILALAVLDLPFLTQTAKPTLSYHADGTIASLTSSTTPLIVFQKAITEEISALTDSPSKTCIMITQNIVDPQQPTMTNEEGETVDRFLQPTDQLVPHRVYTIHIVVLNMTGTAQQLDLLYQIPVGSIPVGQTKTTSSVFVPLTPYSTKGFQMNVYFPKEGEYSQFPAHLFKRGNLVGTADSFKMSVVRKRAVVERTWELIVAENNNDEEVLEFMSRANLSTLSLRLLEPRVARDSVFHEKVVTLLGNRFTFNAGIWRYSLLHDNLSLIVEYLETLSIPIVRSALASVGLLPPEPYHNPVEYENLINSRTHEFGARRKILNDSLRECYKQFLLYCAERSEISPEDHLRAAYFLILMDRVVEALPHFHKAEVVLSASKPSVNDPEQNILFAWYRTYIFVRMNKIAEAKELALKYVHATNIQRLKGRFSALLEEIAALEKLRQHHGPFSGLEAAQLIFSLDASALPSSSDGSKAPDLRFELDAARKVLKVTYSNLSEAVSLNYYHMDVELLFSTKPFLADPSDKNASTNFQYIQPTRTDKITLDPALTFMELPIRPEFAHSNVLIELAANGLFVTETLYSHSLNVQVVPSKGALCVFSQNDGRPLSGVYVKVYSRTSLTADGSFYKDGYTDFAGRFDYAHLNSDRLNSILEFSILLISPEHGAVIQKALSPTVNTAKRPRTMQRIVARKQ